jgi:hypothetical protein
MCAAPLGAASKKRFPRPANGANSDVAPTELHPFLGLASYKDLAPTELVIGFAGRFADRLTYAVTVRAMPANHCKTHRLTIQRRRQAVTPKLHVLC